MGQENGARNPIQGYQDYCDSQTALPYELLDPG